MRKTRKSISQLSQSVYRAIMMIHSNSGYAGKYIQIGGGVVQVNGYRFGYRDIEGGITIFGGRHLSKRPCFILTIDKETAILQSIESGNDCSLDEGATTKHTVLAAAQLAKERGAQILIFTDNSTKHLANGKYFRLSNMYFLTTGKTWYESIFPCRLGPQDEQKYRIWKRRVFMNKWNDVYTCLKKEYPDLDIDGSVDGSAEGSAMTFLQALKTERTDFFADYEAELLMCSGVGSLHGLVWTYDLNGAS